MEIPKDIFKKLLLEYIYDDRTIINMLSTNKRFRDESTFEEIVERKYPLLIPYKKEKETWKNFYIRMVYYISYIQEKLGIPYLNIPGYNPEKLFKPRKGGLAEKLWRLADGKVMDISRIDTDGSGTRAVDAPFSENLKNRKKRIHPALPVVSIDNNDGEFEENFRIFFEVM